MAEIRRSAEAELARPNGGDGEPRWTAQQVGETVAGIEKKVVRGRILAGEPRIDGRGRTDVRDVRTRVGVLPRTHGSALFTRGETQALVAITLGNSRDAQIVDALEGEHRDPFLFHYNFPPYCVGETGRNIGPRRREIGHGRLAKRGILSVMPSLDDFPYVIRVVSEITESKRIELDGLRMRLQHGTDGCRRTHPGAGRGHRDGARQGRRSVRGALRHHGRRDHLGDMDFKVAGTAKGISALRWISRSRGLRGRIMAHALEQAHAGPAPYPRPDGGRRFASRAARCRSTPPASSPSRSTRRRSGTSSGAWGATIRSITEETGAAIDVSDDGTIKIASVDAVGGQEAKRRIEQITADVEVGVIYEGQGPEDHGLRCVREHPDPARTASSISPRYLTNGSRAWPTSSVRGRRFRVKVLEVDKQGRVRLSMKAVDGTA